MARASNSAAILSSSLLRCRRDSNRIFLVVLAHRTTDFCIEPHAASLPDGAHRFVCPPVAGSKVPRLFHWWLAAVIVFIIVVGYGNRHRWYRLPLVPVDAGLAGAACAFVVSKISSRVIAVTLSILLVSSFTTLAFWCVQPFYQSSAAQLRDAGLELKKVTPPDALIVAADIGDPHLLLCRAEGLAFSRQQGYLQRHPGRQRTGDREP